MKTFHSFLILFFITIAAGQTFAAGDYIWEEKFKKAMPKAEQGDVEAQYDIGSMYERGRGTVKNLGKAFDWYSKAANQNDEKAAYKIGRAYLEGKGVRKNNKKALSWFKKSAKKNYSRAQYYLGVMYENGKGVRTNYDEAIKWYKRALDGGYRNASDGIKRASKAKRSILRKQRAARAAKERVAKKKLQQKRKKKAKPKTTKARVLAGGWKRRNKSIEYLPSSLTHCKDKKSRVECLSADVTRNIGMAIINYTTKAILFGFKANGTFKVSYRNNVSKIDITDPNFAKSGRKVPVTLGWQDADHQLTCNFENDRSLVCVKNKLRKIKLHR
jgi:hypothetical protein